MTPGQLLRNSSLAALILLVIGGCSDENPGTGTPMNPGVPCSQQAAIQDNDYCIPHLPRCWQPTWHGSRANPGACTPEQVEASKAKCWGADFDPSCATFRRDPKNLACLQCLFTTEDESSYGALVLLPNGSALSNVAGCMAIVDADTSDKGCSSKYQVYEECLNAACLGCQAFESFSACKRQAGQETCLPFWQAAVCSTNPRYNLCRNYSTFDEYYFAMARIFCVSPDAGTPLDAGNAGSDASETGADSETDSGEPVDVGTN
jgi:hypothetical protein